MKVKTINPSNENILAEYNIMDKEQINDSVKKSKYTFNEWKRNMHQRIELIHRFSEELRKNKRELAIVASNEMGKPIKEAISEI